MDTNPTALATLAGGCFWCLEAVFEQLEGVLAVRSGYTGGDPRVTTYAEVYRGESGHAEVVQVTFDPARLSYDELLECFFAFHDPTTPNRQGADVGTQYRSAIFCHDAAQEAAARATIAALGAAGLWPDPIVTEVVPLTVFIAAEDYHQGYYRRNPEQGYCRAVIAPKLGKLRAHWAARLKTAPSAGA